MALIVNGQPASRARATMPRQGAWTIDVIVPDPTAITSPVTLAMDGGLTFVGTLERGGLWLDDNYLRIAPGANGLKKPSRPKAYRNVTLGAVARDLLATAGETLAVSSNAGLLSVQLPWWTMGQDAIGRCLSALLMDRRLTAPVWRSLPDGSIFIGFESWLDSGLNSPDGFQDLDEAPNESKAILGVESWSLLPGQSLEGRHISDVQHDIDGETVRTVCWFES